MNGRRGAFGLAMLALLAGPLGCVSVAEFRKLENRVHDLSGGDVGAQTRAQLADVTAQTDRMSREIDELRGAVEVAGHRAEQAVEEARAARQEANAVRPAPAPEAPPPGQGVEPAPEAGTPPGPGEETAPDGGAPPGPQAAAVAPDVASPTPGLAPPPGPPEVPGGDGVQVQGSPGARAASSEEVESYRRAYGAWRNNEIQACIEGFREFLQTFQSSPYADDALYWMADCYTKQGDHEKAILRFAKVVELYPGGNKAADALFRQGEVLLRLGPGYANAARDVFERVLHEYPDSPRADEAKRQLALLGAG